MISGGFGMNSQVRAFLNQLKKSEVDEEFRAEPDDAMSVILKIVARVAMDENG